MDATAAGSDTPRCKVLVGPHICCGTQLRKRSASVKKVFPIKKTKAPTNMNGGSGKWLLFGTGHGISWVRDGDSEPEAASACGDVQSKASVDADMAFKQKHAFGSRPSSGLRF